MRGQLAECTHGRHSAFATYLLPQECHWGLRVLASCGVCIGVGRRWRAQAEITGTVATWPLAATRERVGFGWPAQGRPQHGGRQTAGSVVWAQGECSALNLRVRHESAGAATPFHFGLAPGFYTKIHGGGKSYTLTRGKHRATRRRMSATWSLGWRNSKEAWSSAEHDLYGFASPATDRKASPRRTSTP